MACNEKAVEVITLSEAELKDVKRIASKDALFKATVLVEMKLMNKKADLTNGTVRTHDARIASLSTSRTFYNWFMATCVTGAAILIRCLFVIWGKVEAVASSIIN